MIMRRNIFVGSALWGSLRLLESSSKASRNWAFCVSLASCSVVFFACRAVAAASSRYSTVCAMNWVRAVSKDWSSVTISHSLSSVLDFVMAKLRSP